MKKGQAIREKAAVLGFELVGIAPAKPAPDFDFFRWWLDKGYAATMAYLKRGKERRGDAEIVLPGVKSVICCGLNYYTACDSGPVSNYAWGDDYHEVVGEKLRRLEEFIRAEIDPKGQTKRYVDTGPILERSFAARAGLGWIGKNTMIINNGLGSFVFLGEILTTLEFDESEYDRPAFDQCGTCTKCIDACPTGALVEPYVLDSNRCISYLTIEYRGAFSPEQEKMLGEHVYGCDICQQVCPYNDRIPATPLAEFRSKPELRDQKISSLERIDACQFEEMTESSAMNRIDYSQWLRNLKAVRYRP